MKEELILSFSKIAAFTDLNTKGAQTYFLTDFPNLKQTFLTKLEAVVCIDEGCAHKDYKGKAKLALAGAGILFPASSEEERVQLIAKLFTEIGIVEITSHGGCGAVGLAYKRDFSDSQPTAQELEDYGKKWVEKVAAEMIRLGREAAVGHISVEELERPAEFHIAHVVYFDGVGGFNPDKESGLPMGFVISRKFLPSEYAVEELKVAASIAFGHHGFGELFTSETPFVIIPLANSLEELNNLKSEIEQALKDNPNREKIKVDGVVIEK
ncbi:MAG: hypothetical protein G01um101413_915 [Parcubacteria group bacterium Gr01-1014_13]|nr:MAG: hypothetical protein G01um101413_915 [Parcubacteria group bacterium Gr01-1014_13]